MTDNVVKMSETPMGARKIDAHRGTSSGIVNAQWMMRPDDQRFLSLDELHEFVRARSMRSWVDDVDCREIRVDASPEDPYKVELILPDRPALQTSHWSFGQLCGTLSSGRAHPSPATYFRTLPAALVAPHLQYLLVRYGGEIVKVLATGPESDPQPTVMRSITSPSYERIMDVEVTEQVKRIVDRGDGWKVPGTIDWRTGNYDPNTPVTKDSTTLYASDRDVFLFFVRDQFPIEVGTLADGSPDLLFPGFVVSNSEVGTRSLVIESFYLRGVCQNRNLWGVEERSRVRIIHRGKALERFAVEALPALERFSKEATMPVIAKVAEAKRLTVAREEDDRTKFLADLQFSKGQVAKILDVHQKTEGKPAQSVWDFVQAISAYARDLPYQDERFAIERAAGKLMDRVAA